MKNIQVIIVLDPLPAILSQKHPNYPQLPVIPCASLFFSSMSSFDIPCANLKSGAIAWAILQKCNSLQMIPVD